MDAYTDPASIFFIIIKKKKMDAMGPYTAKVDYINPRTSKVHQNVTNKFKVGTFMYSLKG